MPRRITTSRQSVKKYDEYIGLLGNGTGNTYAGNSHYWVRFAVGVDQDGLIKYTTPRPIRYGGEGSFPAREGVEVLVRIDPYDEVETISRIVPDYATNDEVLFDSRNLNSADAVTKWSDVKNFIRLLARPPANGGSKITIRENPFHVDDAGDWSTFAGTLPDAQAELSSLIPGTDLQRIAIVFWDYLNNTFAVYASTIQATSVDIDSTDYDECFAQLTHNEFRPLVSILLANNKTAFTPDDVLEDLRTWLPTPRIYGVPNPVESDKAYYIRPTHQIELDDYNIDGLLTVGGTVFTTGFEVGATGQVVLEATGQIQLKEAFDPAGFVRFVPSGSKVTEDIDVLLMQIEYITSGGETAGSVYWNGDEYTLNIVTGLGPVLQIGQEIYILFYNDTGSQIDNLTAMRPNQTTTVGGVVYPTFQLAQADTFENAEGTLVVSTMTVPINSVGLLTRFGKATGDTTGLSAGAFFLSATVAGGLTNTRPAFPNYNISMGGVIVPNSVNGQIFVTVTRDIFDTTLNFWNGTFREAFDFFVTSNGTVITGTLTPTNGHPDMTAIFSDGLYMLDTDPGATITLTAGANDQTPQKNFVYIPQSTKVLTLSTSGFPTDIEHIRVAEVLCVTAATTQLEGSARRNQNWNDEIQNTQTDQGHLAHIGEWIRAQPASYFRNTGSAATLTGTTTNVYIASDAGDVLQFHRSTFPAQDMTQYTIDAVSTGSKTFTISGDGDLTTTFYVGKIMHIHNSTGNDGAYTVASVNWSDPNFVITVEETPPSAVADGTIGDFIIVINDPSTALRKSINLNDITVAADSSTLNNRWFNIVIWGVRNKGGELSYLMCNLPSSNSYLSEANAIDDASNETVYTIPDDYNGVGFLIARFTIRKSGASFTYNGGSAFTELRGQFPSTAAGGGGGGGGGGTMSSFTITADSGTPETIVDGDAIDIAGEGSIETEVGATDTITVRQNTATRDGYNLIKNYPSLELADGAQPIWVYEDGDGTLTEEGATGEGIPQLHERVWKMVASADNASSPDNIYQEFRTSNNTLITANREKGLDEGVTKISCRVWIYTATAGTTTLELYDNGAAASLGTATTTTTSAWTELKIENITVQDQTQIRIRHSANSATFYVAKPTLNIGTTVIEWRTRKEVYKLKHSADVLSKNPSDTSWHDVDFNSVTSGITTAIALTALIKSTANNGGYLRQNGSSAAQDRGTVIAFANVAGDFLGSISDKIPCDADQLIEESVNSTLVSNWLLSLKGYWEWES